MNEDDWEVIIHKDRCKTYVALVGVALVIAALVIFGACV